MFARSCSYNYILRASTFQRLNTEDCATSANLSTRNSDQAKNLRTKLETRTAKLIHEVTYKVFKESSRVLEIAKVQNHRARTKHNNIKLRQLIDYMNHVEVTILLIGTLDQAPDYLTKAVNKKTLE